MPTRLIARIAAVATLTLSFVPSKAQAASMAFDDASNAIYASDWVDGQNGGFGFGSWILTPNPEIGGVAGAFTASSQPNGAEPKGNIDVGGRSWGLYANFTNVISDAVRHFTPGGVTGDNTLGIGEQ